MSTNSKPLNLGCYWNWPESWKLSLTYFQKLKVFAQWNERRFKICNILCNRPQMFFYSFSASLLFPYSKCLGLALLDYGIKGKIKMHEMKNMWVFLYIKYRKFLSISLKHFIECKYLISEEWSSDNKFILVSNCNAT